MKRLGVAPGLAIALSACGGLLGIGEDDATPEPPPPIADASREAIATEDAGADDATDATSEDVVEGGVDVVEEGPAPACEGGSCDRVIFVTQATFKGNLGGVAGADAKCQAAGDAILPGRVWRAWIGTAGASVESRFAKSTGFYGNVTGAFSFIVAQGWDGLRSASHMKRIFDEMNQPPPSPDDVWTGTGTNGGAVGVDCLGWTTSDPNTNGRRGHADNTDATWTDGSDLARDQAAHLYCVEQ